MATDIHIVAEGAPEPPTKDGGRENAISFVNIANGSGAQQVILLGDIVEQYNYAEVARDIFQNSIKDVHVTIGNHDSYPNPTKKAEFRALWDLNTNYYAYDFGFIRIIVLDTNYNADDTETGEILEGHLPDDQLAWIQSEIDNTTQDVVFVIMHHPPVETYQGGPIFGAEDIAALTAILNTRDNVYIFSGHLHVASITTLALGNSVHYELPALCNEKYVDVVVRKYVTGAITVTPTMYTIT